MIDGVEELGKVMIPRNEEMDAFALHCEPVLETIIPDQETPGGAEEGDEW